MKRSTLLVIGGLLVFTLLATVLWPALTNGRVSLSSLNPGFGLPDIDTSVNTVTLPSGLPVVGGREVPDVLLFVGLIGLVLGPIVVTGLLLLFVYRALDRVVVSTKGSAEFQSGRTRLDKAAQTYVKQQVKAQPPTPVPSHERLNWSAISSTLLLGIVLLYLGAAVSQNFFDGNNMTLWALGFGALGWIVGALLFNPQRLKEASAAENAPVNWGSVFVVMTGVVLVVAGLGVVMWVRAQGG